MNPPDLAHRHSIAVVSERTGLSQDVLRVWERRYAAVSPARGPNGQRLYSDADVTRLRLLHATSRAGRPISQLAAMPTSELAAIAEEDAAARRAPVVAGEGGDRDSAHASEILNAAIGLARELEASMLASELRRAAAAFGVSTFINAVAAPLMRHIGDQWASGWLTIAQEHLATAVLRDILMDVTRGFTASPRAERMVVATPAGERHEIGAAMVAATAAAAGWNVIYLGADLPAADIVTAARSASARVVALSVVYPEDDARILAEIGEVRAAMPSDVRVVVGGAGAHTLAAALDGVGVEVGGVEQLV
jgi:methanogenic corrinoid protein MtbC1